MNLRCVLRRRDDRGAAAVEFALVMPMLFLLVFGIVDFGRMWNMQLTVTHAAREGVRVAALGGPSATSAAEARAVDAADPLTGVTADVTTPCPSPLPSSGNYVAELAVTRPFVYLTPISGIVGILGGPALATPVVTGWGEMRCGG